MCCLPPFLLVLPTIWKRNSRVLICSRMFAIYINSDKHGLRRRRRARYRSWQTDKQTARGHVNALQFLQILHCALRLLTKWCEFSVKWHTCCCFCCLPWQRPCVYTQSWRDASCIENTWEKTLILVAKHKMIKLSLNAQTITKHNKHGLNINNKLWFCTIGFYSYKHCKI